MDRSDSARGLRRATPTEQKGQHKPHQKSTDVRHVCDTTRLRGVGNGTDWEHGFDLLTLVRFVRALTRPRRLIHPSF